MDVCFYLQMTFQSIDFKFFLGNIEIANEFNSAF